MVWTTESTAEGNGRAPYDPPMNADGPDGNSYGIEATPSLLSHQSWSAIPYSPACVSNEWTLTLPFQDGAVFFRLNQF